VTGGTGARISARGAGVWRGQRRWPAVRYLRAPSAACSRTPDDGGRGGAPVVLARAVRVPTRRTALSVGLSGLAGAWECRPAYCPSFRPVPVAAAALDPQQGGERIDRSAGSGYGSSRRRPSVPDAAPLPHQQGAAEQIGPNRHVIESPLVRSDAHEGGGFREQRQLDRRRRGRGTVAAFGHDVATTVTPAPRRGHRNRPPAERSERRRLPGLPMRCGWGKIAREGGRPVRGCRWRRGISHVDRAARPT
jgi:hypothetical protein